MSQLVVDAHIRARLEKLSEVVDLVDESSRKLGRFTPEPICPWAPSGYGRGREESVRC